MVHLEFLGWNGSPQHQTRLIRLVQSILYESDTDHQRKMVKCWRVQVFIICWSLNAETTDGNSPFYLLVFCPKAITSIQQPPFSSAVFILVDEGAREVSPDIIARIGGPHIGGKWCWERYQILKSTGCFYCTKARLTITYTLYRR